MNALERAVEIVGGQTALAKSLGKRQSLIWSWLQKDGVVPAEHCLPIETATQGRVTRHDLRPDIFGPAPQASSGEAAA